MGISESQLTTWSNQGAAASSAATNTSIKTALDKHNWPAGMKYEVYLQGSYPNDTNIRGNSDVDVVVEMTTSFYTDVLEEQWPAYGISKAQYGFADLRREVFRALQNHFGVDVDATGANAIVVAASGSRLKADVLPCVTYRRYNGGNAFIAGVKFRNQQTGEEKINYPKIHIINGRTKNSDNGTRGWYKPSVRIFKNARERIIGSSDEVRQRYPSYFVECLLYNVPSNQFGSTYQEMYANSVNFLNSALADPRAQTFLTQNKQQLLFGTSSIQWPLNNAKRFVTDLITLWNNS